MENFRGHHDYEAIDRSGKNIRVLQLLPGKRRDRIRGRLFLSPVDGSESYDALSYMWGDPGSTTEIEIDGNKHFLVTKNAASALRDLRSENESTRLWIDVTCIDQQNVEERNHQVRLMKQIFDNASIVHVWLNISMQDEHFTPHRDHPVWHRLMNLNQESTTEDFGDDPSIWKPLLSLSENPYWERVWIQQEVEFARELVVHCQGHRISYESLSRFRYLLDKKHNAGPGWSVESLKWVELQVSFIGMAGFRGNRSRPSNKHVPGLSGARFTNIVEGLSSCQKLSATDARDKVYAIINLVEGDLSSEFNIDYRSTAAEVYVKAASFIIEKHNSLGFLLRVLQGLRKHSLPSWVPDWSCSVPDPSGVAS